MRLRHAAAAAMLVLAACSGNTGGELKAGEVAETAATNAGNVVRNLGNSLDTVQQVPSLGRLVGQATAGSSGTAGAPGSGGSTPLASTPTAAALQLATSTLTAVFAPQSGGSTNPAASAWRWLASTALDGSAGTSTSTEDAATSVEKFLRERVFTEGNLESSSTDRATFLLHGAAICTDGTYVPDPTCVQQVDDLELRIRASRFTGGMDFTFIVGPLRSEPATLSLADGVFSTSFDLGAFKQAAEHVATVTGVTIDLPAVLEGAFQLGLARTATNEFEIFANVLSAIHVNVAASDGAVDVTTAATSPLLSLRVNNDTKVVTGTIGLGHTIVSVPYTRIVTPAGTPSFYTLTLDLGGLDAQLSASGGSDGVAFTDVGLGDTTTTVRADATLLLAADLNAQTGRHFDVTVTSDATTGLETYAFGGPVNASIQMHFAPLAADTTVAPGTEDETYTIALGGTPVLRETPVPQPVCSIETWCSNPLDPLTCFNYYVCSTPPRPALEVVSGTLTLDTTSALLADPIVVAAGQCLWTDGTGDHPVLGSSYAAACQ